MAHGKEEHHDGHEKKSVLKKVKAKAKKIKNTLTKHGHQEHGHDQYHYEDQHIPDDHDLDEEDDYDEELVQDPEVHGAPSIFFFFFISITQLLLIKMWKLVKYIATLRRG